MGWCACLVSGGAFSTAIRATAPPGGSDAADPALTEEIPPLLAPTLLFRAADKIAGRLCLPRSSFSGGEADPKGAAQCRFSGLYGRIPEPLGRFVDADAHEPLGFASTFGRISGRWDVLRSGPETCCGSAKRKNGNPAILQIPVTRPIFITGLPRSGTIFLHSLLAEDRELGAALLADDLLLTRERARLQPTRPAAAGVSRQLRTFARLAPELLKVHPLIDIPRSAAR